MPILLLRWNFFVHPVKHAFTMEKALQTRSKLRLPHDLVCEGSSAGGGEGVQMAGGEEVISFGGTLAKKISENLP